MGNNCQKYPQCSVLLTSSLFYFFVDNLQITYAESTILGYYTSIQTQNSMANDDRALKLVSINGYSMQDTELVQYISSDQKFEQGIQICIINSRSHLLSPLL